ncbi:hypothetical protein, partial [Salmonella sp. NW22]|uniref:hypothetical protein n=1 Tax=Salmonella sp. NW22 TaxID=2947813 RepID=UPI003F435026
ILRGVRQQQDEPGRFSICSRQAAVVLYDRNTSMVNIVGVDYEKEIKGSDSCSCVIIQCLLCSYG